MAHILEETHIGVEKNANGEITSVTYFVPGPLFGQTIPTDLDALIIENDSPEWLGHTVNLNVDGDEVVLNVEVKPQFKSMGEDGTLAQVADFVRANGTIAVCELRVNPETLKYEPRKHIIQAEYFETFGKFLKGYRYSG